MQQDMRILKFRFGILVYLDEEEDVEREWQEFKTAVKESTEAAVVFKKKSKQAMTV